jgi:hypothetical protein
MTKENKHKCNIKNRSSHAHMVKILRASQDACARYSTEAFDVSRP